MADERPWWQKALAFSERRRVKTLMARGARIVDLEPEMQNLSDAELAAKTVEFMQRYQDAVENGSSPASALDDLLPEAFAAVRESSVRNMEMRHFDVQMVGGIALHEGSVAEMLTGEGKTLVATLPLYLNALSGNNVHLVTTNDYLAKRDAEWMRPVYEGLGMTVGSLWNQQGAKDKRDAYACNITYGTNSEFGFDYLRDNMSFSLDEVRQRGHFYAIVDEADSILIDEARTPLIISGQPEQAAETYFTFARIIARMEEGVHYEFDEKMHTAHATEEGVSFAEKELGIENLYLAEYNQLINHLIQAIRARSLYHRDKEYVVVPGEEGELEVKIVDEHTGRIMEGRRWSEGLHQAIEAKENVMPQEENVTVASITIQNYFRLYTKLGGMTGTASTEAAELKEIYNLDVVEVPSNKPVQRKDYDDFIFRTEAGKYTAIINDINQRHAKGQPVLVGTIAVEKSEALSLELKRKGIPHHVLNAKQHEKEAEIIVGAGNRGAVTIATNMAGRGIDIKIDDEVRELGGLYVLATERHESRRIDNQLRGRSGRQGDPGESRFFLSAQDDLVRIFAGDRMENVLNRLHKEAEDVPLEARMLSRTIKGAQKRVEERNFVQRKNVLKYDDVLNTQRGVIYGERRSVLDGADLRDQILGWLADEVNRSVMVHTGSPYPEHWELDQLWTGLNAIYPVTIDRARVEEGRLLNPETGEEIPPEDLTVDLLLEVMNHDSLSYYEGRESEMGPDTMRDVERVVFLQALDTHWREHLDNMDYLRDGIGLRGLAQKDPLNEYRAEGYSMFLELQEMVRSETVRVMMMVEVEQGSAMGSGDDLDLDEDDFPDGQPGGSGDHGPASDFDDSVELEDGAPTNRASRRRAAKATGGSWASGASLSYSTGGAPSAIEQAKIDSGEMAPAATAVEQRKVEEKVGRNAPCPCGSGKKYKNCHG